MADQPIRQVAYKVRISDLISNKYTKEEGKWEPNYVQIGDLKVSRVNVIANVISNYQSGEGDYSTITIDDGTESIQLKAWKEDTRVMEGIEIGDIVLVMGKIREYNEEKYITPEIIRKLEEPEWLLYRKKELEKIYGEAKKRKEEEKESSITIKEEVVSNKKSDPERQKILNIVEKLSSKEGADKLEIIKESGLEEQEADGIIQSLLMDGEIFELKPGKIKILG